jgi:hypothetical protein
MLGGAAAAAGAGVLTGPAGALARDAAGAPVFGRRLGSVAGASAPLPVTV